MTNSNAQYQEPTQSTNRPPNITQAAAVDRAIREELNKAIATRVYPSTVQLDALIRKVALQNPTIPNGK